MYHIIGGDGKEYGPITTDQIRDWLAQGRINRRTRVRPESSAEWKPADEIPELASLFEPMKVPPVDQGAPPLIKPPVNRRPAKGLAVMSFVLGLSSFVLCLSALAAFPAILCGHVARRRAARSPAQFGGHGFATTGLALGYLNIICSLVLLAMVLPNLPKTRRMPQRTGCQYNLRQIGLAFKVWALEHNDQFPFNVSTNSGGTLELCTRGNDGFEQNPLPHFLLISNELTTPEFLVCPNDRGKHAASDFASLGLVNVTYRLRTGTNVNADNPQEVLLFCPVHGNALYCDGNVRAVKPAAR